MTQKVLLNQCGNMSPKPSAEVAPDGKVVATSYARIGLMGNPSDGFGGKTVSLLIQNFKATVTLVPVAFGEPLSVVAHPVHDQWEFESLLAASGQASLHGYYGGVRLIRASLKKFTDLCLAAEVDPSRLARNFRISYDTDIPRMVGLSGSSAIVAACLQGLLTFYGIHPLGDLKVEKQEWPQVLLDVEMKELGITAGLQDRVIQTYGGLVHMDFSSPLPPPSSSSSSTNSTTGTTGSGTEGRGSSNGSIGSSSRYTPLDPALLPPLYLAWDVRSAGDSGAVHSDAKQRWLQGDPVLVRGMASVADLADRLRDECLGHLSLPSSGNLCEGQEGPEEGRRLGEVAGLMRLNSEWRLEMYGAAVVGERNLRMLGLAESLGFGAKFTGSGGAAVLVKDRKAQQEEEGKEEEGREGGGGGEGEGGEVRKKEAAQENAEEKEGAASEENLAASSSPGKRRKKQKDRVCSPLSSPETFLLSESEENAAKAAFLKEGFAFQKVVVAPVVAGW